MRFGDWSSDVCYSNLRDASSAMSYAAASNAPDDGSVPDNPQYEAAAGPALDFDPAAREQLARWADGDARRVINAMEVVAESARDAGVTLIESAWLETYLSQNLRRFDTGGEAF